jgi:tRNA U38,U39,U40 pseudouridine synthase TruA
VNAGDRNKVKWSSASRTDKGVHAAACVCSVKLMVDLETEDSVAEKTVTSWNSLLPPDVRIPAPARIPRCMQRLGVRCARAA